jgi:hypothetical protein
LHARPSCSNRLGTGRIVGQQEIILYLAAATVDALAAEAPAHSGITHWIGDITTSAFSKVFGGGADTMEPIRHVQASDALKGEQMLEVVRCNGWKTSAMRSYVTDVGFVRERVRRAMGGADPFATVSAERSHRSTPFRTRVTAKRQFQVLKHAEESAT